MFLPFSVTIIFAAVMVLPFAKGIFSGLVLVGGDWDVVFYPFRQFVQDVFAREGRLPFWNPYILGGMPHLASLNATALYPSELVTFPLNLRPAVFYLVDCWLHLVLAAACFFFWMRKEGQGLAASAAGGLAYALGGALLTIIGAGQPHAYRSTALQPLIFLLLAQARHTGNLRWIAAAGLTVGCCNLTIGLQFVAYGMPVYLVWILAFQGGGLGKRALACLLLIAATAGLSAVILLPGYEYQMHCIRAGSGFAGAQTSFWQFTPWDTLSLLFPDIYGTQEAYMGPHPFKTSSNHAGLIVLALSLIGARIIAPGRRRWIILALSSLVLAMGTGTVFGRLVAQLPFYSVFRASMRWVPFLNLALCVLAVLGFTDIISGVRNRARATAAGLLILSLICLSQARSESLLSDNLVRARFIQQRIAAGAIGEYGARRNIAKSMLGGATVAAFAAGGVFALSLQKWPMLLRCSVILVVMTGELLFSGSKFIRFGRTPAETSLGRSVDAIIMASRQAGHDLRVDPFRVMSQERNFPVLANIRMRSELHWIHGLHSLPMGSYVSLLDCLRFAPGVLNLLNVRYVITAKGIAANPASLPRAFFSSGLIMHQNGERVRDAMRDPDWDPRTASLVGTRPAILGAVLSAGKTQVAIAHGRDEIELEAQTEEAGFLVLSENWYPAWKAFVDGERVRIWKPYNALRGLALPPGKHRIRMVYDSWSFKLGLLTSAIVFAGALTGAIFAIAKRKSRQA